MCLAASIALVTVKRRSVNSSTKVRTIFYFEYFKIIFKVCFLLHIYNQHIQVLPSMQQLFINLSSTTCFDPIGSSSGAASLTHFPVGNSVISPFKYIADMKGMYVKQINLIKVTECDNYILSKIFSFFSF
jgi:hypothetical protein